MAFNSGSGSAGIGFNQNSGGYYITLVNGVASYAKTVVNGTGSGGATLPATVSNYNWAAAGGGSADNYPSTLVDSAGKLIRDLGRTVVSAGRAFRKFQAVDQGNAAASTFGVAGAVTGANAGYLTFYLEVPRGGAGPVRDAVAPIARFS